MKVMHLINGFSTGGAETLVKDYVTHEQAGMEFTVVLTDSTRGGPNEEATLAAGVPLISIPERLGWTGKRRSLPIRAIRAFLSKGMYIREFRRLLREEKPDCIHAHLNTLYLLAGNLRDLKGVRLVYTCHSEASLIFPPQNRNYTENARLLVKKRGLTIIGLHDRMRRELDEIFGAGTAVTVNNCVDMERFRAPQAGREDTRKALGIPKDAFVLGHVGRFSEEKNQAFLVKILKALRLRGINAFALMVGAGKSQPEIREKLEENNLQDYALILQNRADIPDLMNVMNVFVMPSFFEGFPVVMLEAQAAGLKCVISDSIPKDVALTDLVVPVSLQESPEYWCDVILSDRGREPGSLERLEEYDVGNVVKKLARIYGGNNG